MNYQVIEYAVRRYIDKKEYCNQKRNFNLSIKSSGYILGSYYAFVVTDEPSDRRIYEVTYLVNSNSPAVSSYIQEDDTPFFI
nr:MAG TPA: hypothetical protein [Caudoviricetes sp.]